MRNLFFRPRRCLSASTLTLLAATLPVPAFALPTVATLLAQGYRPIASTHVQGAFSGCIQAGVLTFADGTRFTCTAPRHATSVSPPVQVLRSPDGSYAVLIAGQSFAGVLDVPNGLRRARPLSAEAVEDPLPEHKSGEPSGDQVIATEPVYSVGQLRNDDHLRLNDAQRYAPPERPVPGN